MSTARTKARRCAVQALYQWQMGGQAINDIILQFMSENDMSKVEVPYFEELVREIPLHLTEVDESVSAFLDRPFEEVDPVERAIIRLSAYELKFRLDIPYRVVINEAVELAKMFGGEQGHKYVNGVLDKAAHRLRAAEIKMKSKMKSK